MKVAIITLFGYFNYGNRLQNLAMQEILKSLGCEVETLKFFPTSIPKKLDKLSISKRKNIKRWSIKNIKERYIPIENKKTIINEYDYFCIGSDQIFNPKAKLIFKLNFLDFIPSNKKFTFAASFGRTIIKKDIINKYKNGLKSFEFKRLSVRENEGKELIKKLVNKNCYVHLDPALIFNKWDNFIDKKIIISQKKYLLTYFLGEIPEQKRYFIENIAKWCNLEIIELNNIKFRRMYTINPSEFLFLINKASLIFTNSYHGVLFSIVFKKQFVFIETRPKMKSRLDTLFSIFDLNDRKFENINMDDLFNINYSKLKPILDDGINNALNYLYLNINNK